MVYCYTVYASLGTYAAYIPFNLWLPGAMETEQDAAPDGMPHAIAIEHSSHLLLTAYLLYSRL